MHWGAHLTGAIRNSFSLLLILKEYQAIGYTCVYTGESTENEAKFSQVTSDPCSY